MTERATAFSPLAHRAFRWLWIALTVASVGTWMQAVGAQWFLVETPGAASLVALVQAALTLPMAALALPAGVLADNVDRRTLLLVVQVATLAVAVLLAALMAAGLLTPWALLVLTAALGCGSALTLTPFQSLIPDLVSRPRIPPGAALVSIGANLARIIGPALAGVIVARLGIAAVFALNAVAVAFFATVLLLWSGRAEQPAVRERFFPAVRSGVRYVRHSPQVLKLMLRSFLFTAPMMALFALLPVLATERLGMDSSGYGLLFACIGAGAVTGGVSIPRLRLSLSTNAIVATCFVIAATVIAVLPLVTVPAMAMALVVVAGWSWTACLSTMAGALQIYLPAWVRARGLAVYSVSLFGGQAVGSLVLGWVVDRWGLPVAYGAASATLLAAAALGWWLPLKELDWLDRTPTSHWPEPELVVDPDEIGGEVVVTVEYWIDPADEDEFRDRMEPVRRIRLRTGGIQWRLMKDAEVPRRFLEEYTVGSWEEHHRQHHGRLVASDQEFEQRASALSQPPPVVTHLFRIDSRERVRRR